MYLYDRKMVTNTNLKYANSSSNYYVIIMVQKMGGKNEKKIDFQFFSHSRGTKCRVEANNNGEAVVVCARHVVKRASKRSVLVIY